MPTKINLTKFEIHIIFNLLMKVGNIDNRKKPKSIPQIVNISSGFSQDSALIDSILPCEFKNS